MNMNIMVIAAHPSLKQSRANRAFTQELARHAGVYVRDLYQMYPDWRIDAEKEQQLLLVHDRIVFQFPFYWYSCPPLLKKWFDDVFTYGWAFGSGGDHLKGKSFIVATTAGGSENGYRAGGDNWFTVDELLRPIQSTITRCNGIFLPAFVTYNADRGTDAYLSQEARRYAAYIQSELEVLVH
jgi:glutathione-regulated potassium-efflux system ancillary protein KefG